MCKTDADACSIRFSSTPDLVFTELSGDFSLSVNSVSTHNSRPINNSYLKRGVNDSLSLPILLTKSACL